METTSLLDPLTAAFAELPQTMALALGGSRAGPSADAASDIDFYVYTRAAIAPAVREGIVARLGGASRADLDQNYWGPSDQWLDAATGTEIDVVYFDAAWMEAQVRRVLDDHVPAMGYTTAFCHTIRHSQSLYDPGGWLAALQARTAAAYPESLRRAIIAYNHPLLRGLITSYAAQMAKALRRDDRVSLNHRLAALLAGYFDIMFAANRVYHPGEKQILARAAALCPSLPEGMAEDVTAVLAAAGTAEPGLMALVDRLLDRLDVWLVVM